MEIRWFKETNCDCVCVYKNRHMINCRRYKSRMKPFTDLLENGDVSLSLANFTETDLGVYLCQVTSGNRTKELTVNIKKNVRPLLSMLRENRIHIQEINRTWTEEERLKMKDSVVMSELNEKLYREDTETRAKSKETALEENSKISHQEKIIQEHKQQQRQYAEEEPSGLILPVRRRNSIEWIPSFTREETASAFMSGSELRLVLLGSAGCEKRSAGNIILNTENQTDISPEIQQSEIRQEEVERKQVTVVETPDWFCSKLSLDEVRQDVRRCIRLAAPGPHVFLLVIPVKQSTGLEREMIEKMVENFGERCWKNTMILFTVTDEEQKKNIENFVKSENREVQRLVEKCGNRFQCLNIHQSEDGSQVSDLLGKIEKMVQGNRERFYSSEIYLDIESQIRSMERKIIRDREERKDREEKELKERIDKEVQNFLRKIEGVIEELEGDIKRLNKRTDELERQMREERDEEIKKVLKRELDKETQKRIELEKKIYTLKEKRKREKSEMEERHRQEMEKIKQMYEGEIRIETEKSILKNIMPELQRYILNLKLKMQEEFNRQMEEKNREIEALKMDYSSMCEFHESAMKILKHKNPV